MLFRDLLEQNNHQCGDLGSLVPEIELEIKIQKRKLIFRSTWKTWNLVTSQVTSGLGHSGLGFLEARLD